MPTKLTINAHLILQDFERARLAEILEAFQVACRIVRTAADKHNTHHQVALHHFAYRLLTDMDPGTRHRDLPMPLPAQYAHRAIQRVADQARASIKALPDPYPARSFDLDARCADLRKAEGALAITTLDARGLVGGANRDLRCPIKLRFASRDDRDAALNGRLLGATITVAPKGSAKITLRVAPRPPENLPGFALEASE